LQERELEQYNVLIKKQNFAGHIKNSYLARIIYEARMKLFKSEKSKLLILFFIFLAFHLILL